MKQNHKTKQKKEKKEKKKQNKYKKKVCRNEEEKKKQKNKKKRRKRKRRNDTRKSYPILLGICVLHVTLWSLYISITMFKLFKGSDRVSNTEVILKRRNLLVFLLSIDYLLIAVMAVPFASMFVVDDDDIGDDDDVDDVDDDDSDDYDDDGNDVDDGDTK